MQDFILKILASAGIFFHLEAGQYKNEIIIAPLKYDLHLNFAWKY